MAISTDIRDNKFFQQAVHLGIEQGEAKALRSLLVEKFGSMSETIEQRLSSLIAAEIEIALKRVLRANQIEDVFGNWQN